MGVQHGILSDCIAAAVTCEVAISAGSLASLTQSIASHPLLADGQQLLQCNACRVGCVGVGSLQQAVDLGQGQGGVGGADPCCGAHSVGAAGQQGTSVVCLHTACPSMIMVLKKHASIVCQSAAWACKIVFR